MKKLTNQQKSFIKGALASNEYFGNLQAFLGSPTAVDFVSHVERYAEKKKDLEKTCSTLYAMDNEMDIQSAKPFLEAKKSMDEKKEQMLKQAVFLGLKAYLELNKIAKIHRPETFGNKGDYTGNDYKKDEFFEKNPQFVAFDSDKEYEEYIEIEHYVDYEAWWKRSNKYLTTIKLAE